jgi:diacylglycerol kinase
VVKRQSAEATKSQKSYFQRRRESFGHAARGVRILVATQPHARIHLVAAVGVTLAAWLLGASAMEWCVLLLAIGLVWVSEGVNTALELAVDLASPEHHPTAGKSKDVAAGAVLLASCLAAVIGAVIFLPKLAGLVG